MKTQIVAALLLFSAIPCGASPKHFWNDKRWWAGEAVILTSVGVDAESTCANFNRGVGSEGALFVSGNHSCGTTAGIAIGAAGFYTFLHAAEWHFGHDDDNKYIRFLTPASVTSFPMMRRSMKYAPPAPKIKPASPNGSRRGRADPPASGRSQLWCPSETNRRRSRSAEIARGALMWDVFFGLAGLIFGAGGAYFMLRRMGNDVTEADTKFTRAERLEAERYLAICLALMASCPEEKRVAMAGILKIGATL